LSAIDAFPGRKKRRKQKYFLGKTISWRKNQLLVMKKYKNATNYSTKDQKPKPTLVEMI